MDSMPIIIIIPPVSAAIYALSGTSDLVHRTRRNEEDRVLFNLDFSR